jgi:hypothetical protein
MVVNPMLASRPTPGGLNVVWHGPSGRDVEAVPLGPCTACGARVWMKRPHIPTTLCRRHPLLWSDVGRYNCACMCCRSRAGRAAWWHCRRVLIPPQCLLRHRPPATPKLACHAPGQAILALLFLRMLGTASGVTVCFGFGGGPGGGGVVSVRIALVLCTVILEA